MSRKHNAAVVTIKQCSIRHESVTPTPNRTRAWVFASKVSLRRSREVSYFSSRMAEICDFDRKVKEVVFFSDPIIGLNFWQRSSGSERRINRPEVEGCNSLSQPSRACSSATERPEFKPGCRRCKSSPAHHARIAQDGAAPVIGGGSCGVSPPSCTNFPFVAQTREHRSLRAEALARCQPKGPISGT